jgi:hypothetical protein
MGAATNCATGTWKPAEITLRRPFRRAHYFAPYGRARPAKTQGCTAVSARLLIRMKSEVQLLPGPPSGF